MNRQIIAQHFDRLKELSGADFSQISQRLLRDDISTAESSYVLSKAYLLANEFSSSAELAAISLCLHPGAPQPWHVLGVSRFKQGNPQTGFEFSMRAVTLNPHSSEFCATTGLIALDSRRLDIAEVLLKRAISLDPSAPACHLDLGVVLDMQNEIQCALQLFEREAVLNPTSPAPYLNAGNAQMALGNPADAAIFYEQAVALGLNSQQTVVSAALAYLVVGDFENGWRLYESRLVGDNVITRGKNLHATAAERALNASYMKTDCRALVWAEQGVGDEVMFGSMLGEFRAYVGKLLVQLDRRLIPLFKRSLPDDVEFSNEGRWYRRIGTTVTSPLEA